MVNDHQNCNCYDCLERTAITDSVNDEGFGESKNSPDYYLDSILIAKKPVKIYTLPGTSIGGKVKLIVQPGKTVGHVDSWVRDKKSPKIIWWKLKEGGYTPHFEGFFDQQKAVESSSGKKFVQGMVEADKINLNPAPLLQKVGLNFGALKWVLIAVLLIVLVAVFLRIKG